jgi:hypothetical protein
MNRKHLALLAALVGTLGYAQAAAVCPIKPIHNHGPFIKFGMFKGHLISPDDPASAAAWEGPLVITQPSGTTCSVKTGIFDASFFQAGSHFLYATIYSGSEANQILIDARDCSLPWVSPQFTGDPHLTNHNSFQYHEAAPVKIGANCMPVSFAQGGRNQ